MRNRRLDGSRAVQAMELFLSLPLSVAGGDRESAASLSREAYGTATRIGSSYYDALFLALADQLGTDVVTADDGVFASLSGRTNVIWVADALS